MQSLGDSNAKNVVVCFHGWYQSAKDMRNKIKKLLPRNMTNDRSILFVFPQANSGKWFDYISDASLDYKQSTLVESRKTLLTLLNDLKKTHTQILLVGYSQGGCMALDVGDEFKNAPILSISAFRMLPVCVNPGQIYKNNPNVSIVHGTDDNVIPLKLALKSYKGILHDTLIHGHDHWQFWSDKAFKHFFLRYLQKHIIRRVPRIGQ